MLPPYALDDDWPQVDLMECMKTPDAHFLGWVKSSPRRAMRGSLLVLARKRAWTPGSWVVNMAPKSPEETIWSFDFIRSDSAWRATLPLGVAVEEVALVADDRVRVVWRLEGDVARSLGISPGHLAAEVSIAGLQRLPEPTSEDDPVGAFCEILESTGATEGRIRERAESRRKSVAAREADERQKADKRNGVVLASVRNRRVEDLGPLSASFSAAVREAGLAAFEKTIGRFARVCVALGETGGVSTSPLGVTRVGGLPDLPRGMRWPTVDDELLSFIMQVRLEEVPDIARGALPKKGLLSLFVGRNDSTFDVEHEVLLLDAAELAPARLSEDARFRDDDTGLLKPVRLNCAAAVSLPVFGSDECVALESVLEGLSETDWLNRYEDLDQRLLPSGRVSLLLPHWPVREKPGHSTPEWTSLLRVESHLSAGLSWWDAGLLDVVVKQDGLVRGAFEGTFAHIYTS